MDSSHMNCSSNPQPFLSFHHNFCYFCRFVGQSEWFRADSRGKFNWDFLNYKDTPVEEVDMSHTIINYVGLSNLGNML